VTDQWQFEVDWGPGSDLPVQFANQFAVQPGPAAGAQQVPDGIYVTVASIAPPIFVGTPEQVQRQASEHPKTLPVRPLIKFAMSKERAQELVAVLLTTIQQLEDAENKSEQTVRP
jgi:hypothetical protein